MKNKPITICRCEEVGENAIEQAINDGARTIDAVKRATRAGMGLCQGRTCQNLVAAMISSKTGQPMACLLPATSRPPFRPIKIRFLAEVGSKILQEKGHDKI
jgi:NAD(P)H-nitrite reductase large subunit